MILDGVSVVDVGVDVGIDVNVVATAALVDVAVNALMEIGRMMRKREN